MLHRLTLVQRSRQTGFTLSEIKELFVGFSAGTPPPVRWQKLTRRKIHELDAMLQHIQFMRDLMKQQEECRCRTLEERRKKMFEEKYVMGLTPVSRTKKVKMNLGPG